MSKGAGLFEKEKEEASNCIVMPSTSTLFQVSNYSDVLEFDIGKKTCICKKWDLRGIPCHVAMQLCALVTCVWMSSPLLIMDTQKKLTCGLTEEALIKIPERGIGLKLS